jgi:hypothetical protein
MFSGFRLLPFDSSEKLFGPTQGRPTLCPSHPGPLEAETVAFRFRHIIRRLTDKWSLARHLLQGDVIPVTAAQPRPIFTDFHLSFHKRKIQRTINCLNDYKNDPKESRFIIGFL